MASRTADAGAEVVPSRSADFSTVTRVPRSVAPRAASTAKSLVIRATSDGSRGDRARASIASADWMTDSSSDAAASANGFSADASPTPSVRALRERTTSRLIATPFIAPLNWCAVASQSRWNVPSHNSSTVANDQSLNSASSGAAATATARVGSSR